MTAMNTSGVRVIDPILSTVVQGYANQEFIGMRLFPRVPVSVSGGQILQFGKESFQLYSSKRSAGGNTKRVQFGYLGEKYALENHSLEGVVPREHQRDAAAVIGFDLAAGAVRGVMRILTLGLEVQQAKVARDVSKYPVSNKVALAGNTKWTSPTSTPIEDIDAGREAIRRQCGLYPNVLVLSALAFNALKNHPDVVDRFKFTSAKSITAEMLAGLLNVESVVVGKAIYFDDNGVAQDVWGNDAILAYVPPSISGMEEPSYGYTYTMEGNPIVEPPYYDNNTKSWIYPVTYECEPVIAGITGGYLISNAA